MSKITGSAGLVPPGAWGERMFHSSLQTSGGLRHSLAFRWPSPVSSHCLPSKHVCLYVQVFSFGQSYWIWAHLNDLILT